MARPRKIVSLQTGNLTRATKDRRAYEEGLAASEKASIKKVPKSLLVDDIAVAEYKRVLKELLRIDIIGDLDRGNLIVYCNAFSGYMRACEAIKQPDFDPIVANRPSPWYSIRDQERKAMEAAGKALGMSVSSRLSVVAKKADQQEEALKQAFGDI